MRSAVVPIHHILVIDRARDETDVSDIDSSSKDFGQIQSIAVRDLRDDELQGELFYKLLAGGRRISSFIKNASLSETILVRIYPSTLTPVQEKQIELLENTARRNLTWQQEVKLSAEIASLEESIDTETGKESPEPIIDRTAKLRNRSTKSIKQDIRLAKALNTIPELSKCKTADEAENLLARLEEKLIITELAKRGENEPKNKIQQRLIDSYILGDCFIEIKSIKDESIDLVEFDPPYSIESVSSRDPGKASPVIEAFIKESFVDIEKDIFIIALNKILDDFYRIMKPNSWLICWYAAHPWANDIYEALIKKGFLLRRIPAIWNKSLGERDRMRSASPDNYLGRMHENFYYARKGEAVIRDRTRGDVFNYSTLSQQERIHPTEKPLPLMQDILKTFAMPGSSILCPFLGSGNTILAAHQEGMTCTGWDLAQEYKDRYTLRVKEMFHE